MKTNSNASSLPTRSMRRPARFAIAVIISFGSTLFFGQEVDAQLAAPGQTRIAYQYQGDPINMTSRDFADVPGLAIFLTVPDGKVAEALILFSAEMNTPDALSVQALVDGFPARPGPVQVLWNLHGGATSQGFNFFSNFLAPGSHVIKMQWSGLGGKQFMSLRSMTVILNVHDP